jgi:uncharacterized protein (TIGR02466 family)
MNNMINVFSAAVYSTFLNIDNNHIKKYCLDVSKNVKGRNLTNEGGYQSNDLNLSLLNKSLLPLITEINKHTNLYKDKLELHTSNLDVGNIWFNINGYKDYNTIHNHPGSIISGVYYVNTFENCGDLVFWNDFPLQYYWNDVQNYNSNNSCMWKFKPVEGTLYLFPSWLRHEVKPNMNKNEKRISISFNCAYLNK